MQTPIRTGALVRLERFMQGWVDLTLRIPGAKRILLSPVIARPGYWFATGCGFFWGFIMGLGRMQRAGGVLVARALPHWAFGRGGTTIGAVFLTRDVRSTAVLEHEAVHRAQWKRYGLAFIPLYIAAGAPPDTNRFEIEAGLEKGGYR